MTVIELEGGKKREAKKKKKKLLSYHKLFVCNLQDIHQLLYQAIIQNTVGWLLECIWIHWWGEAKKERKG